MTSLIQILHSSVLVPSNTSFTVYWYKLETWCRFGTDDVAIIFLEESAENEAYRNEKIWPACLPVGKQDLSTGTMSLTSGWGSTQPVNSDMEPVTLPGVTVLTEPYQLQQVWIPLIGQSNCQDMLTSVDQSATVGEGEICAGLSQGGKDSCQGDSGGPLVVFNNIGM